MNLDRRFLLQILATVVIISALAAYPLIRFGSREIIVSAITGALLATLNVLMGYVTIEYAFDKSYTVFLRAVLGGMGLRVLLMLGVLIALIMVANFHVIALAGSLFVFYAVYLILEVLFLQRKTFGKNRT